MAIIAGLDRRWYLDVTTKPSDDVTRRGLTLSGEKYHISILPLLHYLFASPSCNLFDGLVGTLAPGLDDRLA